MTEEFDIFKDLQALSDSSFPKRCSACERTYLTVDQYIQETEQLTAEKSGLKQSWDDDDSTIVELYRNCLCGSTLMDFFTDRRDLTERGSKRRKKFQALISYLVEHGVEKNTARAELIKVIHGEKSELLGKIKPPK